MKFYFEGVPVSVGERESKDGKKYFNVSVDCDGELLTFDCTDDVAKSVVKYQPAQLVGNYMKGEYQGRVYTRISVIALKSMK